MKKAIFAALALALTLGAFQDSWAAGRTSIQLATTANLTNDITKPDPESVPIGTVIAWPHLTLPSDGNWLECNGQTVNTILYPEFVAKFGSSTPDYRGMFLRGYGSQKHTKNNGTIIGINETVHSSGSLGAIQGDAIRNITGTTQTDFGDRGHWYNDYSDGVFYSDGSIPGNIRVDGDGNQDVLIQFNASRIVPVANENRPVNKAVKYIIKVR